MALLNSILRGKSNSKVVELEIQFLLKAIQDILENKWIEISSPHSFNDLIYPIADFQSSMPFIWDENPEHARLWTEVEKFLYENYHKLSG